MQAYKNDYQQIAKQPELVPKQEALGTRTFDCQQITKQPELVPRASCLGTRTFDYPNSFPSSCLGTHLRAKLRLCVCGTKVSRTRSQSFLLGNENFRFSADRNFACRLKKQFLRIPECQKSCHSGKIKKMNVF
jgi:hypothetical protein